jgi:hypothetical protein
LQKRQPDYETGELEGGLLPQTFRRSIVGATCAFVAKKSVSEVAFAAVSLYNKSSKKFFKNSDFTLGVPAFLFEILGQVL